DLADNQVMVARRDKGPKEKLKISLDELKPSLLKLLEEIQQSMFDDALRFLEENSHQVDTYEEFKSKVENELGFIYARWCGSEACEVRVQEETKATIRCIPFDQTPEEGPCICCGESSVGRVPFAKAY
ncbi:MAG: proline--tRNA ligase, partial [bacterium]